MAFSAILLIIFAIAIGYATFVENNTGVDAARNLVYDARWFEILLFLLCANLLGSLVKYKSLANKKWSLILFHLSFVVIIIGAGITRYFSYEGFMHIREGESSNIITTAKTSLTVNKSDSTIYSQAIKSSLGIKAMEAFSTNIGSKTLQIKQSDFILNAAKMAQDSPEGKKTIALSISDSSFQFKNIFLNKGEDYVFGNITYSFSDNPNADIIFIEKDDSLYLKSKEMIYQVDMINMEHQKLAPDSIHKTLNNILYQVAYNSFAIKNYYPSAIIKVVSMTEHSGNYPLNALKLDISYGEEKKEQYVFGAENLAGDEEIVNFSDASFKISYGSEIIKLPFALKLDDFIIERYVNSMSPSSFKSNITLVDESGKEIKEFSIFMNNILNYKGYRFFQSSYDEDENGTILSVNYDPIGTIVTYLGYSLMVVGMFLALFSKKSHFRELLHRNSKIAVIFLLGTFTAFSSQAQPNSPIQNPPANNINHKHAERFGHLLIADPIGRIKPISTFASEINRKIMRENSIDGYTSTELFLSMMMNQELWENVPTIKISNSEIIKKYNFNSDRVSINQILPPGSYDLYLIKTEVDQIYQKEADLRTKYDKEILKLDEKVNLSLMLSTGSLFNFFPLPGDSTGKWIAATEMNQDGNKEQKALIIDLYGQYYGSVKSAIQSGDWKNADIALDKIFAYQKKFGGNKLPPAAKVDAEVFYNKVNFFKYASKLYLVFGLVLLISLFVKLFNNKLKIKWIINSAMSLIVLLFILQTAILGLRWYISGHAPWSNGYETTLFIAWATVLAGILFAKRSTISLALTAILAAILILISGLSWMDPEITNLVPVLKSYWLIIHVAVITSSYGFFALIALMGLLIHILLLSTNERNTEKLLPTIKELSSIIEMAQIIGLYLLTIGTFLGAVWANESWGRYWGWDPKETWALVSILVYTFIGHLRHIPGFKSSFVVSTGAVLGFGSILMTFFGVNYFLSGMHSYGAGEAFAIPLYSKIIVISIFILIISAGIKYYKSKVFSDRF